MNTPVLARTEVLERVDGDIEFLTELTKEFLGRFPSEFAGLVTAASNLNATETERKAHSLKGALRNLGGVKSGETAHKIEIAAKKGDLSQSKQMLEDLEQNVKEFEAEFYSFIASI